MHKQVLSRKLPLPRENKPLGPQSHTPSSWEEFFDNKVEIKVDKDLFNLYVRGKEGPIFLFLHGGGYSGATWAQLALRLTEKINCRIVCPDLRGHGDSKSENELNISKEQQIKDISEVFRGYYEGLSDFTEKPAVCVVGHSMGGALAVHAVSSKLLPNVVGLAVIDVVEGSAMQALSSMQSVLRNRPTSFGSLEEAIKWALKSGATHNVASARVSMPTQLKPLPDGKYTWRIDLSKTAEFWPGWFSGLSKCFVEAPAAKLLILAGVDRLDKELMIAQMQGKFQTVMLPGSAHAIHEDLPEQLAEHFANFAVRNGFSHFLNGADKLNRPTVGPSILHP